MDNTITNYEKLIEKYPIFRDIKKGQIRVNKEGAKYKVMDFDPYCFINHQFCFNVSYLEVNSVFTRVASSILEDELLEEA